MAWPSEKAGGLSTPWDSLSSNLSMDGVILSSWLMAVVVGDEEGAAFHLSQNKVGLLRSMNVSPNC